ncbi:MAG: ribosome silencing factor [Bryobacteraceae bacterium]
MSTRAPPAFGQKTPRTQLTLRSRDSASNSIVVRYEQEAFALGRTPSKTSAPEAVESWLAAVRAAESKKATDIRVLDLSGVTSFTDHFVICSGANPKQIQAIAGEVGLQLKARGQFPMSLEGYNQAEWILADYGDFIVHVFSEKARAYYDLERLWRNAKSVAIPD